MFAQADTEQDVTHYATADIECKKVYDLLRKADGEQLSFSFIDITKPYTEYFSLLDFKD